MFDIDRKPNGPCNITIGPDMYLALVAVDLSQNTQGVTPAFAYDDDTDPPHGMKVCAYVLATLARYFVAKYKLSPEQLLDEMGDVLMQKGRIVDAPAEEGK